MAAPAEVELAAQATAFDSAMRQGNGDAAKTSFLRLVEGGCRQSALKHLLFWAVARCPLSMPRSAMDANGLVPALRYALDAQLNDDTLNIEALG